MMQQFRQTDTSSMSHSAETSTNSHSAVPVKCSVTDPDVTVLLPHDSAENSSHIPSSFSTESLGDKSSTLAQPVEIMSPVHDSSDDSTPTPKGTKLNPTSLSTEELTGKDSALPVACVRDFSSSDDSSPAAKRLRPEPSALGTEAKDSSSQHKDETSDCGIDAANSDIVIMVCDVTLRKADFVKLEMTWVDGQNRELMYQLLQFFKNRLV